MPPFDVHDVVLGHQPEIAIIILDGWHQMLTGTTPQRVKLDTRYIRDLAQGVIHWLSGALLQAIYHSLEAVMGGIPTLTDESHGYVCTSFNARA